MRRKTVKRRIFISNTLMVIVTLVIFLVINLFVIRGYAESIEKEWRHSVQRIDRDHLDSDLERWTVDRDSFYVIFGADGILCIVSLVVISQLFTKNLTDHIMKPLDALEAGAERIKDNNLGEEIDYRGDLEFEHVCGAFNDMQASILAEQEKNRKYEKARTDMIAGISHDLRTPLTAIKGTIKGLMDGVASTPDMQKKFLEASYRRTGDMDRLLNQLLYLSRIETGNVKLSMHTVEIGAFLRNYVKSRQDTMEEGRESLTIEGNDTVANVSIDPDQFQRVLDNLLGNSRKYAEAIPLQMRIELKVELGDAVICFRDNGVGVPEEKMPHIFEEFYRGDESRNKKEGNGLGLYIVRYLIEAMGGNVRAENEDGLAVYMELPAEKIDSRQ